MSRRRKGSALQGWAVLTAVLATTLGCATNPATGKKQISLISEQKEIAIGEETDKEIVASMGLYDDSMQRYIQELGESLASTSERPDLPWTFRVVDDPIVNAFALPGGYIYITRGIMAHMNSEAELAGVVGHEIGHVTARHSVNQLSKQQLYNIGLGVGSIVSPEFRAVSDLAQMGLGLLFLKHSRDDERQADDLGLRYSLRAGYDAREMPNMYEVLDEVAEASGGGDIPNWLSTHPNPENRGDRIRSQLAAANPDLSNAKIARTSYLRRLDGVVFGENPREGFFENGTFYHPDLAFRMDFPGDWKTRNQKQGVTALGPNKDAALQLTLAEESEPRAAAQEFLAQEGIQGGRVQMGHVNGLKAASATFESSSQGSAITGRVVFVRHRDQTFQLLGYTPRDRWSSYSSLIEGSLRSFAPLTDPEILQVGPARLDIIELDRAMTVAEFNLRYPSSIPLEQVALINQVEPDGQFSKGQLVKRVVGGPKEKKKKK